ncbi:hypothetical protein [Macrococcus animalis]|uniref:hypothetical protein n=1 Tax=Macrococcus animalis TaxID=3395467 RepID=UPI0039BE38D9
MGIKERWITSLLLLITIVGLIFAWEQVKPEWPKFSAFFGDTPKEIKGKRYNTIDEALKEFAQAYADDLHIDEYQVHHHATDKFIKQNQIPGVITFNIKEKNPRNPEFKLTPIYINNEKNQYYVTAYGISGSSNKVKESSKYSHFSQPIKSLNYDFMVAIKKAYLPKTDVVLPLKEKNMYVGINAYPESELDEE